MRVGFLNNQIDNRGTGNAVYDYAHYNEEILGNESIIFTYNHGDHNLDSVARYLKRFEKIKGIQAIPHENLDVLYHIKSGYDDGFPAVKGVRYVVHAVFDYGPHGDRYAMVSKWLADKYGVAYVPHIVDLPKITDDLRGDLGLPKDATVFGRHGGIDTFDIPWAWDAIKAALRVREDIYFLFMNTAKPATDLGDRVIFIDPTANPYEKRAFINTCDAMLHARSRGETFGISVGEFAICGKPIITYGDSPEKAHFFECDPYAYWETKDLVDILTTLQKQELYGYQQHTPENVMAKFKEVFLD